MKAVMTDRRAYQQLLAQARDLLTTARDQYPDAAVVTLDQAITRVVTARNLLVRGLGRDDAVLR